MKILLLPLTALFSLLVLVRNWLYDNKWLSVYRLKVPVICVGNLTTGGTGKTPWVQWLSQRLHQADRKAVILSRGYTGDFDGVLKVSDDMDPRKCGDEPLWLKRNTSSEVYIAKNRYRAALTALKEEQPDVFLLDDGFQHRSLFRDLNIVIIDASADEKHLSMLPFGRMREPFSSLKRAQLVIINKCNFAKPKQIAFLRQKCASRIPSQYIFHADFRFDRWAPLIDDLKVDLDTSRCAMACGVGNPKAVIKTIVDQGIAVEEQFIFPDHHFWKPRDIEKMTYKMKSAELSHLLITEKDAVKLVRYSKHFKEMLIQLWVCKMRIQLHEDDKLFINQVHRLFIDPIKSQ